MASAWGRVYRADLPELAKLPARALAVYLGLATYCSRAGGYGRGWVTAARLADDLGVSRATVFRGLDDLEGAGWITRERTRGANRYRLASHGEDTRQGLAAK